MSNTNSYIVLTEQGLSAVATQPWPQISLKYFLPMYDERIDKLIHTDAGITSAVPLSASVTSADSQTTLVGERIYNIPSTSGVYQLSTNNVASSGVGSSFNGINTIFVSTVNRTNRRTLLNSKSLAPTVSGNVEPVYNVVNGELQFNNGSAVATAVHNWTINGSNIPRENLFDSVSFNPSQTTSGSYNVVSGLFKFILRNNIGSFRFNKIAMFIQPMNTDGSVNTSYDPVLFGQVVFDTSQIVEIGGQGSQTFEVTVQLSFTIKDSMVVLTNNDYWSMIPTSASSRNQNGLFFAGDIALGTSSVPNSWQPKSKLHITDDSHSPQIRLSHSTGLSGLDITFVDDGTSGLVSFQSTSGYSKGVSYSFGKQNLVFGENSNPAFAFGTLLSVNGENAFSLGQSSSAFGQLAFAFGLGNMSSAANGSTCPITIGMFNRAIHNGNNPQCVSIGYFTSAFGGIAIGETSLTSGYASYAFGTNAKSLNAYTMSLGFNNSLYSVYSFALGFSNTISGAGAYNGIIGLNNRLNNNGQSKNWIFGADNILTSAFNAVAVGNGNTASLFAAGSPLMFGNNNNGNDGGLLIGRNNSGPGNTFGDWSYAYYGSLSMGTSAFAGSRYSISIGINCFATQSVAASPIPGVGYSEYNIGLGFDVAIDNTASYNIAIGRGTRVSTVSGYAVTIGDNSRSTFRSTAIGPWTLSYGIESVAVGWNARTYKTQATEGADDSGLKGLIAIGSNSTAWNANYGIAIGNLAEAKSSYDFRIMPAISIGPFVKTSTQSIGGEYYSMTTIGHNIENEYAGFMAGISPYNVTDMINSFGAVSTWNFLPSVVFGAGINEIERTNGLSIGRLKNTEGDDKIILVLNSDRMPTCSFDPVSAGDVRYNSPKGTIFKHGTFDAYGFSVLYVYNPDEDAYR